MRKITNINAGWLFTKTEKPAQILEGEKLSKTNHHNDIKIADDGSGAWETVNLPHTWNGQDGQDGGNDYYRGTCCYVKHLGKEMFEGNDVHYLEFDGVNSSAEVYWNGKKAVAHHGGYSTFRVRLEEILDQNTLVVAVDNSANDFVYPQNADFTFYGGIYRDVKIISLSKTHFAMDYYGTPGIKVTPVIKGGKAEVKVDVYADIAPADESGNIDTASSEADDIKVQFTLRDQDGHVLGCHMMIAENKCTKVAFVIDNPHLWHGVKDPYLYTVKADLLVNTLVTDTISARFGCRSFEVDPEKGFILNGQPYPLRGVSRHQDRPQIGNALLPEHHKEDIDLILEMGANTIRLAHYQHAQYFYDLCDENGLIIWAEIPYITTHMPNGLDNTVSQMKELIVQNYNHPCIVTWGLSNEISFGGAKDQSLLKNHYVLNNLVHQMDKTRPTTMAVVTMCDMNEEIVHISDIVSYNHYFGWYGGNVNMYGKWFDNFHSKYPEKPIGISEYGCEALNWHSSNPVQGDYTEEYQAYYHEELIKTIAKRPYLWATHVWNMFDFAADARAEGGGNGMNHKGLVTFDRKYKKDAFYAYKAWLSDDPFVHICGKRYVDRVEDVTNITVYSNLPEIELFVNGASAGKQKKGEFPFFYFGVKNKGESHILVKAGINGEYSDESMIRKVDVFNEDYRMKEEGEIINWFEITTPAGYYSINDTIGDIGATLQGKLALAMLIRMIMSKRGKGASSQEKGDSSIKINKEIIEMASGFTVKRVFSMVGMLGIDPLTKEEMLEINRKLNKVRKK